MGERGRGGEEREELEGGTHIITWEREGGEGREELEGGTHMITWKREGKDDI